MRRRNIVLIGAAVVVLLAAVGAGAAWWVANRKTADVHNGATLPFTLTSDPSHADVDPATRPQRELGPVVARVRALGRPHPRRLRPDRHPPALPRHLERPDRLPRVSAGVREGGALPVRERRLRQRARRLHGQAPVAARAAAARRRTWARGRRPSTPASSTWARATATSTRSRPRRGGRSGTRTSAPRWSPRLRFDSRYLYMADQNGGGARARARDRQGGVEVPGRRAGEARAGRRRRPRLLRRLRRGDVLPERRRTAARSGTARPTGSRPGCARATSSRPRRWRTDASTSATPTTSSTRSSRRPGRWPGRTRCPTGRTARRPSRTGASSRRASTAPSRAFDARTGAVLWQHRLPSESLGLADGDRPVRVRDRPRAVARLAGRTVRLRPAHGAAGVAVRRRQVRDADRGGRPARRRRGDARLRPAPRTRRRCGE